MHKVRVDEFEQKPLRVHSFLAGIPLRTLARVDLPGGRQGMTLPEIDALVGFSSEEGSDFGPVTQALFGLRSLIGRILHWCDAATSARSSASIAGSGIAPVHLHYRQIKGAIGGNIAGSDSINWVHVARDTHGHLSLMRPSGSYFMPILLAALTHHLASTVLAIWP